MDLQSGSQRKKMSPPPLVGKPFHKCLNGDLIKNDGSWEKPFSSLQEITSLNMTNAGWIDPAAPWRNAVTLKEWNVSRTLQKGWPGAGVMDEDSDTECHLAAAWNCGKAEISPFISFWSHFESHPRLHPVLYPVWWMVVFDSSHFWAVLHVCLLKLRSSPSSLSCRFWKQYRIPYSKAQMGTSVHTNARERTKEIRTQWVPCLYMYLHDTIMEETHQMRSLMLPDPVFIGDLTRYTINRAWP